MDADRYIHQMESWVGGKEKKKVCVERVHKDEEGDRAGGAAARGAAAAARPVASAALQWLL